MTAPKTPSPTPIAIPELARIRPGAVHKAAAVVFVDGYAFVRLANGKFWTNAARDKRDRERWNNRRWSYDAFAAFEKLGMADAAQIAAAQECQRVARLGRSAACELQSLERVAKEYGFKVTTAQRRRLQKLIADGKRVSA
jgi:hypothetical protein